MRLRKKKVRQRVSYGLEIDGGVVYSVRSVNGVATGWREYRGSESDTGLAQALNEIGGKAKVAVSINGPVDRKEVTLRVVATSNPTVLTALIRNAASDEMGDMEYTAARRLDSEGHSDEKAPSYLKVILMGMIGSSEIDALFSRLGDKQCFVSPVQGLSYCDGVHLHLGRRGAALYFIQGGAARRTSFVDGCRFEDFSGNAGEGGSVEERAQRATEYLRRLTESVSQDLTGWRRNDPAVGSRIFAHGAGAALSSALEQSFALREIEVEILGLAEEGAPGPQFEIARITALEDTSDDIRSFANPLWEKKRLERIRSRGSRTKTARIATITCGLLSLTVIPTVAAASAKQQTSSDITNQGAELVKYQPVLTMYKEVSSETAPIRTAEADALDWTKVWQFLQATQPAGATVRNLSILENAPGVVTLEFSTVIASQTPFAPIVTWIKAMKSHGARSVQTSTMTYSASSGVQTTSFELQLDVGSATGVTTPTKRPSPMARAATATQGGV